MRGAHGAVLAVSLWLGVAAGSGCNGKKTRGGEVDHTPEGRSACEEIRAKATSLYRAEMRATDDPEERKLEEQIAGDNVEMVMADCHADPRRVAPCVEAAVDAPQLERDCLIPLDDEGTEGLEFLDTPPPDLSK